MLNTHVALTALTPLDGRYNSQLTDLANLFSEFALMKQRVHVEVAYLIFMSEAGCFPGLTPSHKDQLVNISTNFSLSDAETVKQIEQTTRHDVKAVEYFIRQKIADLSIPLAEYVHLALTSEDVNSLAYSLMIQDCQRQVLLPSLCELLRQLSELAESTAETPMLAKTHGQVAVPTTVGKELAVFAIRLLTELEELEGIQIEAKLTGAVGNFNAHVVAFPKQDWLALSDQFVRSFNLKPSLDTTQILPTESYSRLFSSLVRINSILLDLNQDIWRYISDHVFGQKVADGQVGSSTMPQKVNPIDFENSEGNLGLANSLLMFFIQKLPISRLQRDLSDSTVKRSIGTAFGYCHLAYTSLHKGLLKITVNEQKLTADLESHWEVLAEAFQVILRIEGDEAGYEKLKTFTQGKQMTKADITAFVESLSISAAGKQKLLELAPHTYLGLAPQITHRAVQRINRYLKGEL